MLMKYLKKWGVFVRIGLAKVHKNSKSQFQINICYLKDHNYMNVLKIPAFIVKLDNCKEYPFL